MDQNEFNDSFWAQFLENFFEITNIYWIQKLVEAIMLFIIVVGGFGNLLICIVIYCDKRMHTTTNCYLFNMAVSDFIVSFALGLELCWIETRTFLFGSVGCKLCLCLIEILWSNGVLTVTALAIERFIVVWYPMKLKSIRQYKRVIKVIIIIWILSIVLSLPDLWLIDLIESKSYSLCLSSFTPSSKVINVSVSITLFFGPMIIILVMYLLVAIKVNSEEKNISQEHRIYNRPRNRFQVNKMVVSLSLSFIVCWLPFLYMRSEIYMQDTNKLLENAQWLGVQHIVAMLSSWSSVVLNPLLFSLMSTKFRKSLKIILSTTKYLEKKEPYTFLVPWLGEGLLTSNGSKWHERRKLLTPAFHFDILKKFSSTFIEHTQGLLEKIQLETQKEQTDPVPLITKATLKVMCETSMGISVQEKYQPKLNDYFNAVNTFGECFMERSSRVWFHLDFIYNLSSCKNIQDKAISALHKFTNCVIDDRKIFKEKVKSIDTINSDDEDVYGRKARLAMLDLLLEHEKQGEIDKNGIREEVDTFMFEGHDTTAMALSWFLLRIANEKEIQDKIFEELHHIFGSSDREPTMKDFAEMKYLELCIKESLRLYPSVPIISRYLEEDAQIGGYTVPRGTMCYINIFDIHRDERNFPDPEKFIPERFLPENVHKRHRYSYIPFSAGPRNCIGQKFAILEMKTVISGIIRKFQVEPITKLDDIIFVAEMVLRSKKPYYVRYKRRDTA